ncbi:MAG TPA: hypothetical protein P5526_28935 [Anaerolineae bacterium]|nr:hypothetical protein [Anaerolineae bacterium]MCB0182043.1 hypothetical protein [Anaerolineae bacterium]MCB0223514.1 hypothetical protein [Anaerolineae bacterium]MCB9109361.1 hypothetical protein [Anaerolineales bacterium]HRV96213.1 hypothetical protein [Anaerolineae bacterium]
MKTKDSQSSWIAFGLFYAILLLIVSVLDTVNHTFSLMFFIAQVGLITVGVGVFAAAAVIAPNLSATLSILLAFTVGILTIIPAVLMGLGRIPGLWPQYFYIAFGMAAGSLLTFFSLWYARRITTENQSDLEKKEFD